MSDLWKYGYLSRLTVPAEALTEILAVSRKNNAGLNVTGLLIFDGRRIFQLLEGPRAGVAEVVARLTIDRRHTDFSALFFERDELRWFSGFEMDYRRVARGRPPLSKVFPREPERSGPAGLIAAGRLIFGPDG